MVSPPRTSPRRARRLGATEPTVPRSQHCTSSREPVRHHTAHELETCHHIHSGSRHQCSVPSPRPMSHTRRTRWGRHLASQVRPAHLGRVAINPAHWRAFEGSRGHRRTDNRGRPMASHEISVRLSDGIAAAHRAHVQDCPPIHPMSYVAVSSASDTLVPTRNRRVPSPLARGALRVLLHRPLRG